ncbi:MAG: TetR/AcrR family transcriptional regulator [Lachnospiraceae bacterium]|nr:TetR/AcrR family transcriptional regulator [Lachnospiraceae bacterium]
MPRDKTESHNRIIDAARKEFLEYGFADASLRRIAAGAGIQVSGLYKHFSSKEEMFASLVDPAIEGLMERYRQIESSYFAGIEQRDPGDQWTDQREMVQLMEYIYDHQDAFRLIICNSRGTRYAEFTHELAVLEEEVTLRYMQELKKGGHPVREVDEREFHLLVTASLEAVFQAVIHDFDKKEAMHYAETLEQFYLPAWKALFGL